MFLFFILQIADYFKSVWFDNEGLTLCVKRDLKLTVTLRSGLDYIILIKLQCQWTLSQRDQ